MEQNLRHALEISDGSWGVLVGSPLAIGLYAFALAGLVLPYVVGPLLRRRMGRADHVGD